MKSQNLILGGILLVLGIGGYLFLTKKKTTEVLSNAEESLKTTIEYFNKEKEALVGKSTIADVPVNSPLTNVNELVKNVSQDAVSGIGIVENNSLEVIAKAKAISAKIAENKRKQRGYKKSSSKRNIQTVIDADIAKLLAMGYKPLDNGEIQKV